MKIENDKELTITHLAPLVRRRRISPVELTGAILERIERYGPALNAFITVTAEMAMAQAGKAEREIARGRYRGALHGIPLCLKDLFHARGVRTTAGSKILRRFVPKENAVAVDRLEAAGAVLVGKTNLHEFAFGATSAESFFGPVRNPWNPDRMSGGSSGGSAAAVAGGLSLASLGTDTGGSIRIPSAACGCVGLKPTYGLAPLVGVIPLSPSLDHVGPMCRSVEDAALVLQAIATESGGRRRARESFAAELGSGLQGLTIGVPRQYFFSKLQIDVRRNVLAAVAEMERGGAEVKVVDLKWMRDTARLAFEITAAEAAAWHWKWLKKRPGDYDPRIRARMEEGAKLSAVSYLQAQELRRIYTRDFAAVFESVDVLAVPAIPVAAPAVEDRTVRIGRSEEDVRLALLGLTRPANLTGLPAITVPCGFTSENLPTGLQLIGRRWGERTLLRAAYAYEQATEWHRRFPPDLEPAEKAANDGKAKGGRNR